MPTAHAVDRASFRAKIAFAGYNAAGFASEPNPLYSALSQPVLRATERFRQPPERLVISGVYCEADAETGRKNNMPKEQVDWPM